MRSALLWFLQIQRVVFSLRALQGPFTGYIAAGLVVVVWSFWLVISRLGATSTLTIYDLAAMRYGVSGLISLPLVCGLSHGVVWDGIGLVFSVLS